MSNDIEAERKLLDEFEAALDIKALQVAGREGGWIGAAKYGFLLALSTPFSPQQHSTESYYDIKKVVQLLSLLKDSEKFSYAINSCIENAMKYLNSLPAAPALSDEIIQLLKDAKIYLSQVGCDAYLSDWQDAEAVIARIDAILPKE